MKAFVICGLLAVSMLAGCGGGMEPADETEASASSLDPLPACEEVQGLSCRLNVLECVWQATGQLGTCGCRQTPAGPRLNCR
ncbi:hypothetical protein MFUL124B02_28980 [Myxococcus fulvus 124B02]|nr:hypothetical protein MFUL124B02_28980 [Myxococcus fulvus 124B02]